MSIAQDLVTALAGLSTEAAGWPIDVEVDGLTTCQAVQRIPDRRCKSGYREERCGQGIGGYGSANELTLRVAEHMIAEHWKPGYPVPDPPGHGYWEAGDL